MPDTIDIKDVEVFEAGKHKGDEYTEADLDDIVTCFNETKSRLKPYMKLGHNPAQVLLQQDGMPSAGWITGLKRSGRKLVADFSSVPGKIADLIQRKAYGRFSSEIFWNGKIDNKEYRRGLRAVALLGGDTPAVQTLNDFINLYTDNNVDLGTMKIYDDEADIMPELKELETQLKKYSDDLLEAKTKEVQFTVKITDLENQVSTLKTKIDADEKEKAEIAKQAKGNEIKMFMDAQVKDGKMLPAQVKMYSDLAEKDFDSVKGIISNMPKIVDLNDEQSEYSERKRAKKTNTKKYSDLDSSEQEHFEKEDEIDTKIREYSEKEKVSYNEAYSVIMREMKEGN